MHYGLGIRGGDGLGGELDGMRGGDGDGPWVRCGRRKLRYRSTR